MLYLKCFILVVQYFVVIDDEIHLTSCSVVMEDSEV